MGRQSQLFLMPEDVLSLVESLKVKCEVMLIDAESPEPTPRRLETPLRTIILPEGRSTTSVYCYLTQHECASINLSYLPKRRVWGILDSSEVIQFAGCRFDGSTLESGRFYYQSDSLIGDDIWSKKAEFVSWAERVFRTTKRLLRRAAALDAYLGPEAERWHKRGGKIVD